MHFQLLVHLLLLSLFLISAVVSIEPITMSIGAAAVGKHKIQLTNDIILHWRALETILQKQKLI